MKFSFAPNQVSSLIFVANSNQALPDDSFLPTIDELDISSFNGKTFLVAQGAGDASCPDVIGNTISQHTTVESMLEKMHEMRFELYMFPKLFIIDNDICYMVDPISTAILSQDPAYYANAIGGTIFINNMTQCAPGFAEVEIPKNELNTMTHFNNAIVISKPGETVQDVLNKKNREKDEGT